MVIFQTKDQKQFIFMSSTQKTTTTTPTTTAASADVAPVFQLNQKKLKELAENANAIKIGGKVRFIRFSNK
jgi:hypothetical protein